MKTKQEILDILEQLDLKEADCFEDQELDFKEWVQNNGSPQKNYKASIDIIVTACVAMANGGGGTIVVGVKDKSLGKENVIIGVPNQVSQFDIMEKVYERTDPRITPHIEAVDVPYGTGKILVINVLPGNPPYTESNGCAKIRVGKSSVPFTGSMRANILTELSESDFTAELINEDYQKLISPSAMEKVRDIMEKERAPEDLRKMNDEDLLSSIGALKKDRITKGALLLVGKEEYIKEYIPYYSWGYRKMINDTDYSQKDGGQTAIPVALYDIERYVNVDNPITTLQIGFVHPEIYQYPKLALREGILNSFLHRDFRVSGSTLVKQYPNRIEISNPGDFIGGITVDNILHHPSKTRNPHLADLMDKLKLINRSNLGVPRIYKSLLAEGKEPPQYRVIGKSIELIINASNVSVEFLKLLNYIKKSYHELDVDHLIILNYLMKHREIELAEASRITQRGMEQAREVLSCMENEMGVIESDGNGRSKIYMLSSRSYAILEKSTSYYHDKKLDFLSNQAIILSTLKERGKLTNADIRQITGLSAVNVRRLMKRLESSGVRMNGKNRGAYYHLESDLEGNR